MRTKTFLVISAIAATSFSVFADDGHNGNNNNNNVNNNNSSFESSVIGSTPGMAIGGVNSGGAPWVVAGEANVSASGNVRVEVQGLLIAPGGPAALVGTTGPVTMVGATLMCGGSGGTAVADNGPVTPSPLSAAGNAEIQQAVTLPASCAAPVVLVRIFNSAAPLGSQLGPFIAETGLMAGAQNNQNQNQNNNQNHDANDDNGGGGHGH
jgi:hypothetical protein